MSLRRTFIAASMVALLALSGCSSVPVTKTDKQEAARDNDPIESVNRAVFDVNDFLDRLLIRPMAELYRFWTPAYFRDRVASILKNMGEPVVLANNLMQGEMKSAGTTLSRFLVNTTAGVGGMYEVASGFGLERQEGDFGQTLHVWGAGEGPYLVLPLFGPSNVRDAVGLGVDTVLSPWKYVVKYGDTTTQDTFTIADMSATALTRREQNIEAMDSLREGSIDFYAQMRSVYRQYRAKKLGLKLADETPVFDDYEADSVKPVIR